MLKFSGYQAAAELHSWSKAQECVARARHLGIHAFACKARMVPVTHRPSWATPGSDGYLLFVTADQADSVIASLGLPPAPKRRH